MSLKDELETVKDHDAARSARESLGAKLTQLARPVALPRDMQAFADFKPYSPEERAQDSFMDGLRKQAARLASGLQENQELQMFCYHGPESLRVLEISMPSTNVVSLRCLNDEDEETHVTGHMHSVTFSFVIHTIVPPEVRRPLGFNMPSEA